MACVKRHPWDSNIEAKVHDIPVAHDVILSFAAQFAGFSGSLFAVTGHEIIVSDHLGTNKAALEIRMNDAGRARCRGLLRDGPGARLLGTGGEVGFEPKQAIAGAHDAVQARLVKPQIGQELGTFRLVQFYDLSFDGGTYRHHDGAFGIGMDANTLQQRVVFEAILGDIGHIHARLGGEKE